MSFDFIFSVYNSCLEDYSFAFYFVGRVGGV